jgi:hypothetical protein
MKENITAFEGTLHKLTVNVSGVEDFSDYLVYGAAQPYGCSKCAHFEVVTKTEGTCEMIIPALSCGIYKYQLFIKRISTNQEFLILEGEINVKDRLCDCSAVTSNDETATVVDATFSADTVEVNVSIQEGAEGKPGPQGPQGEPGKDGKDGEGGGGSIDIQESKKRALEEYYGLPLGKNITWVAYNALGGVTACSDDLIPSNLTNCDIEKVDYDGFTISGTCVGFLGKELTNFKLRSYNQMDDPDSPGKHYGVVHFDLMPNLESFKQYEVDEKDTIDISKIELESNSLTGVGNINFAYNNSLKNVKIISGTGELKYARAMFDDCNSLETVEVDFSNVRDLEVCFRDCNSLKNFTISNPYIKSLSETFYNCSSLESVTIDAEQLTSLSNAFTDCKSLTAVNGNFPNVISGTYAFKGCESLVELPSVDYSKLLEAGYMFEGCESLTRAPEVISGTRCAAIFNNCKSLENVSISFPDVTYDFNSAFSNCSSLKSANVNAPKTTTISNLFGSCTNLEEVNLITGPVYYASSAFRNCKKIKNIPSFNVSTTCSGDNMCDGCESLESFTGDLSNFTSMYYMFNGCKKLKEFSSSLAKTTSVSNMFYNCILDASSVKNIFNSIATENSYSGTLDFNSFGVSPLIYLDEEIISLLGITESTNLGSFTFNTTNNAGNTVRATIKTNWHEPVFDADLSTLSFANYLFYYNKNLVEFKSDISTISAAQDMFSFCSNLESFEADTTALINGYRMFYACEKLKNIQANFDNLVDGRSMFGSCRSLTEWNYSLNKLTRGSEMFQYSGLRNWNIDLPALTEGNDMFRSTQLKTFEGDLSSLGNANYMFKDTGLQTFRSALPSITRWEGIFDGCNLDAESVRNILTSLTQKSNSDDFNMGVKRSAVPVFTEIMGKTPTSTTSYQLIGYYKGKNIYVKITSED